MIRITSSKNPPDATSNHLLAVAVSDAKATALEERFGNGTLSALAAARFEAKPGQAFRMTRAADGGGLEHVLFVGVGESPSAAEWLKAAHQAASLATEVGASTLTVDARGRGGDNKLAEWLTRGACLGTYQFGTFLPQDRKTAGRLEAVTLVADEELSTADILKAQHVAEGVAKARDLGNGPPGQVTPTFLADTAAEMVAQLKGSRDVELKVLERDDCEALGMGLYLGVAQGSDEAPKFIHLTYRPKAKSRGRVALVGKGVTFDSGGYSLKPTDGMLDMKLDMAGSAAVLGAFWSAAQTEVPWEVHVIVAAAENLVSGHAYKLGDVLTASDGTTVEINNTDAEGRLTLADALIYAGKLEPDYIVDFATLTGACIVALGPHIAGVMSPDDALVAAWTDVAATTGEEMWRLPLPPALKEQLRSELATMKNTGERWGGALTAGLFLQEFTKGQRWMHVDIAGPGMASKPWGITSKGGSGFPVATIVEFLHSLDAPAVS